MDAASYFLQKYYYMLFISKNDWFKRYCKLNFIELIINSIKIWIIRNNSRISFHIMFFLHIIISSSNVFQINDFSIKDNELQLN